MDSEVQDSDEVEEQNSSDLLEDLSKDEIAASPSDLGDPVSIVETKIPKSIRDRYEVFSYRNAATILSETRKVEFEDLLIALENFKITKMMIRKAGGNESDIPKLLSKVLRPLGWYETVVQGDLLVKLTWRGPVGVAKKGKKKGEPQIGNCSRSITREKYPGRTQDRLCERPSCF